MVFPFSCVKELKWVVILPHKTLFVNELADVVGHVLLLTQHHNINIEEALERKWFTYLK